MISSLQSIFNPPQARVLLIASERVILYLFAGGEIEHAYIFPADTAGLGDFDRCLAALPHAPVCVLIDVVEEEYREETIPHVRGADRKAVLERKYARLFRGSPYHHALAQGRESEGRRDDRVLLTAMTRPEALTPWLDLMLKHEIPVTGIYSLPILSASLLKLIGADAQNVLLISLHKASGLRQTFFRDGQLKLSRLAFMPRLGSVPFAAHLIGEVEKLRRYLNSLTLIGRESPLSVYILSHGHLLRQLEEHCRDSGQEKFVLLDVDDVALRLGLKAPGQSHYSDFVFARLLASKIPPNHYGQRADMRFYSIHRLRTALATAGICLLLASAGWSALNFAEGVNFRQQAMDVDQKSIFYQQRYDQARQKLPPTPVEPHELKVAVEAIAALRQRHFSPEPGLRLIGAVLLDAPAVALDDLRWAVEPETGPEEENAAAVSPAAPAGSHEVIELTAHLDGFGGDYRAAIELIDGLAARFKATANVSAEVLEYPLDTSSTSSVSGAATGSPEDATASFKMKLVMRKSNGGEPG